MSIDLQAPPSAPARRRVAPKRLVGVIAAAAVLTSITITSASAAATAAHNPIGHFDSVRVNANHTVTASGWAFDPDAPATGDFADLYIDGRGVSRTATMLARPDVVRAYRNAGPRAGFSTTSRPLGYGAHSVCLYAINRGPLGGNVSLGCRVANVVDPNNPHGITTFRQTGTVVTFSGRAFDPNTAANVALHYRLDGKLRELALANLPNHGFSRSWALAPGTHLIQVVAMNAGAGTANPLIGQARVVIAAPVTKNALIAAAARTFVGKYRYASGGSSPATGFDCSGLTAYIYAQHGIGLPHNAQAQMTSMRAISQAQARPGDLVFFLSGGSAFHVGVYEGGNMMVSAATTAEGIKYQAIWSTAVRFGTNLH